MDLERDREIQITTCEAAFNLVPDCRFRAPQDLLTLPDSHLLVISQAALQPNAGELLLYDPIAAHANGSIEHSILPLYPGALVEHEVGWGDAACGPPAGQPLSPRGIDAVRREDGRLKVVVVNEGARRAVEVFELAINQPAVDAPALSLDNAALIWRGCVQSPAAASFGDIAADARGGFWITQAFPRQRPVWSYLKARLGFSTGYLYRWRPDLGFERLDGTEARLPSGIALTADGRYVFYGTYLGDEVRKLDVESSEVVARAPVMQPTKMSWGQDGRLLVASHTANFIERGQCDELPNGACGFSFEIVSIEPESMDSSVVLSHQGAPIGAVDAVVNVGDSLYLASPLGDRVVRFTLDPRDRHRNR
jgi:hypothetical protein